MKTNLSLLLPLLTYMPYVAPHGHVSLLTIDGITYNGNTPSEDGRPSNSSVIRRIRSDSPVKGANNAFINCGLNASHGSQVALAKPGSNLTFKWEDAAAANGNVSPVATFTLAAHFKY
jgi:hypothetical protein